MHVCYQDLMDKNLDLEQ